MDISQVFNMSLEFGHILSGVTTGVTGSMTLTFILIIAVFVIIAGFFHMPELLYIIPLIPILLMFSIVDPTMRIFLGVIAIFLGYMFYSILPIR